MRKPGESWEDPGRPLEVESSCVEGGEVSMLNHCVCVCGGAEEGGGNMASGRALKVVWVVICKTFALDDGEDLKGLYGQWGTV